jgi:Ca2+-binding EF-hand superfamily protein
MNINNHSEKEILKIVFTGMKEKYFTFDLNGDGTITNQEFRKVLENMVGEVCPDEVWNEFISKVDYDNSGTISFEEFLYALYLWFADEDEDYNSEEDEKDEVDFAFVLLKNRFKELNKNSNDLISKDDFKNILKKISNTNYITEEVMDKIYQSIPNISLNYLNFKQYLYGIYLFVTEDYFL